MQHVWIARLVFSTAVGLAACSMAADADDEGSAQGTKPGPPGAPGTTGSDIPCDVQTVLATQCQSCHGASPQYGAPMPLVTLADLNAPAVSDSTKKVYDLVRKRTHDATRPMPPKPNAALSPADLGALDAWIDQGAKTGASCASPGGVPQQTVKKLSCTPDILLKSKTPYAMAQTTGDRYVCVGVDANVLAKRHITGFQAKIDNATIVHHVLLLQSDKPGPATPEDCGANGLAGGRLVYAWAAGGQPLELPTEAGFPIDANSHYSLQFHYNNARSLPAQSDNSGIELCTTETLRPNEADVVAFGSMRFTIPPRTSLKIDCDWKLPSSAKEINVFGAMPHMHNLGTSMSVVATTGGGAPRDLGKSDVWDWNTQVWSEVTQKVKANDNIHTTCNWKNTTDNPVSWGEGTADEMCFSFTMYYPKMANLLTWAQPSAFAKCSNSMSAD